MQKIIIKNFKAIKDTEIEIKKVLILIGEQATGKSTIAKLIYFFKSVVIDEFWSFIFSTDEKSLSKESLIFIIQTSFFNFFGFRKEDFEITFYYDYEKDTWLKIKSESGDLIITENIFGKNNEELLGLADVLKKKRSLIGESTGETLQDLKTTIGVINNVLIQVTISRSSLFTIAGRSTTVGYSSFFENTFYADLKAQTKQENSFLGTDEILMYRFMVNVLKLKGIFRKYGGFEGLIQLASEEKKAKLILIKEKAEKILKGKYSITGDSEKLILDNNDKSVYLSDSSSGQQEAIRIIQDIFYNIYSKRSLFFRIVEEPEAHLFPTAQKELVELFALMVNDKEDNQLIITTHSPYILTAFNNLLFAHHVANKKNKKQEVEEIVEPEFWLDPEQARAYLLTHDGIENILDQEQGLIASEKIDKASELIYDRYSKLSDLYWAED